MAHLIYSINATLGGTCFHEDVIADDEHHHHATELVRSADALLLGRNTYDLFEAFWPQAVSRKDLPDSVVALAKALSETPRYVASNRPLSTTWEKTTRVQGPNLAPLLSVLSSIEGKVVLFGSPGLAGSLAKADLLDEVQILLQPLFSDRGPALPRLWHERPLHTVSANRFMSGAVLLRYASHDSCASSNRP